MARTLARNVHVAGTFFKAGDSPDKEYAEQITNPKAWGEADEKADPSGSDSGAADTGPRRSRRS